MGTPGEKIVVFGTSVALVLGAILAVVHGVFGVTWGPMLVGLGVLCCFLVLWFCWAELLLIDEERFKDEPGPEGPGE